MVRASKPEQTILKGDILYFTGDPALDPAACRYIEGGMLVLEDGCVKAVGEAEATASLTGMDAEVVAYPDGLIMPGFIDTHIHYPQTDIIASYGEQLLQWLEKYTFPAEARFTDPRVAAETAEFFLDELMRCGTTTAAVYATVHAASVEAFFNASQNRQTRMICGKLLMDRNAPAGLCDTPESGYEDSKALIARWHQKGRQLYAVTPRFALTSSPAQLASAGALLQEVSGLYMQTHIAEDRAEVAQIKQLYPQAKNYLDVYDHYGLLSGRSVFAHGIHLSSGELERLTETGASVAFCPSSNLFLGSGLLDLQMLAQHCTPLSLATDVGGGTSFSMLQTMADAYKVASLSGYKLPSLQAFYMATLGNARTLGLDNCIGSLAKGCEADVIVLDKACTPLLQRRLRLCDSLEEMLFVFMMLGDDRAVKATWVNGQCQYEKQSDQL